MPQRPKGQAALVPRGVETGSPIQRLAKTTRLAGSGGAGSDAESTRVVESAHGHPGEEVSVAQTDPVQYEPEAPRRGRLAACGCPLQGGGRGSPVTEAWPSRRSNSHASPASAPMRMSKFNEGRESQAMTELISKLKTAFAEFSSTVKREEGQGLVEYALILVLVSIVAIAALAALGTNVKNILQSVANHLA